ncbi:GAF domain-containing protein [Caldanaerobius fijiensis DSM 17918]|uniref:GAF domain-containing protein n=1 Tax=Caldanaerobius fijiensis DSM 17918 TaxID=1121256 RepID=A0A1M5APR8_9THEO|nr:GAF domain-containing protein [Caldanaerobius fijiensis DSM 17918]
MSINEKKKLFADLMQKIREVISANDDYTMYEKIVKLLKENVPHYHWVGFYFIKNGALELGPYIGRPTEHTRIEIGQGICGSAVAQNNTIIVEDVTKESNYLACSVETKSEIVVPLYNKNGAIIGEIDIDSDELSAFDEADKEFLEELCRQITLKS